MPTKKELSFKQLSSCFGMTAIEAAVKLGLCVTSLKKMMRKYNISRWPFRKLKSLNNALEKDKALEAAAGTLCTLCTLSAVTPLSNASPEPPCSAKTASKQEASLTSEDRNRQAEDSRAIESVLEDTECWPTFSFSGVNFQTLVLTHWSTLWTPQQLNKYIVNVHEMTFSDDGTKAYLKFHCQLAAVQAKKLGEDSLRKLEKLDAGSRARPLPVVDVTCVNKVQGWLPLTQLQHSSSFEAESASECDEDDGSDHKASCVASVSVTMKITLSSGRRKSL
jgi:hypothetical protein